MKNVLLAVCFPFVLIAVGCQSESSTEQVTDSKAVESAATNDAPKSVDDPKSKAIAAKDALVERLSAKLVRTMSTQGPSAAIEVCSNEAAKIAIAVGEKHGVKIGRTSLKLRNPANQPPEWVKPLLDAPSAEPQVVNLPADHTGVLLPIKLQAKCMTCHGPTEQIPDAILAKLAEHYPNDQATGFQVDDLRGWFWVEVPNL